MGLKNELVIKLSAEADASLNETLGAAKKRIQDLSGNIADLAQKATIGFGAFAIGAGLVTKGWVDAAGQMEQYRAKLETVLKSSREAAISIQEAVAYAAKTPFNVRDIVDATATLTVYGVKAKEVLPLVANLAAGMGKSIEETALTIGKAWSGSYEGFEGLRNQYGITIMKMKQYGAVVDEQGSLQLKSNEQVNKAREALEKIIKLNFGGAVERQMNTWKGATSNLSDAFSRLQTQLGNELLPVFSATVRSVTSWVEAIEKAPKEFKNLAAWGAVIAGAMAATLTPLGALARTVPGATASISLLNSMALNYITTTMTGTAALTAYNATLAGTPPIIALITTGIKGATAAAMAFVATPLGASIAVITAIAGGLAIGFNLAEKESKKLEAQITAESNALQKASWEWHTYLNAINEANKATKKVVEDSANVNKMFNSLTASIREMSTIQISDIFIKMGMGKRDINDQINADRQRRKSLADTLELIQKIESYTLKGGTVYLSDLYDFEGAVSFDELKKLQEIFGGNTVSAEKFKQKVTELKLEFKDLLGSILTLDVGGTALDKWEETLKSAKRAIKDIVAEIEIMQSTHAFKNAAEEVVYFNGKLSELQAEVGRTGAPGIVGLGDLTDTKTAEANLRQNKKVLAELKKQKEESGQTDKGSLQAQIEAVTALVEAQKKGADAGKKVNDKKLQDQKDYISKQKDLNQMNIDDEIKANERMLQNKNLEVEQRKEIETNIAKLKHDKTVEGRGNTERSLQKELDAVKLMTSGQVKEYDRIIAKIKEKKNAQDITEKQAYGLNKSASESRKTQAEKDEKDSYDRRVKATETYLNLVDKAEEMSNEERLRIIDSLEKAWYEMERQRTVTTEQAEDQIKKLIEKRATLEKKIIDANKQAEQELINLRKSALDSDIKKLGDKMKVGQNVEKELYRKLDDRTKLEMKSFETKDDELRKQGVSQSRRDEIMARSQATLYEKQAEEIGAMISELQNKLPEEQDRLTKMSMESLISSLSERKGKLEESYKSATSRADIAQKQSANEPPLKQSTSADLFNQATNTFSASVKDFSAAIIQMIQNYQKDASAISAKAAEMKMPSGVRSTLGLTPGQQQSIIQQAQSNQSNSTSNTSTYIMGDKAITPTAEVAAKWGGLAEAVQKMRSNGYLDSIGGSFSY